MGQKKGTRSGPKTGKRERYIQPSILLSLHIKRSYGYEIIQEIQRFGFVEGQAPPGMIYRHLRQMEEIGLVFSEWEITGVGPAKRVYDITDDGRELLAIWIEHMKNQAKNLENFVEIYSKTVDRK